MLALPEMAAAATANAIYTFPAGIAATNVALAQDGTLYGAAYDSSPTGTSYLFHLTPPSSGTGHWSAATIPYLSICPGVSGAVQNVFVRPDGLYAFTGLYSAGPASLIRVTPPAMGQTAWGCTALQTFSGGPSGGDPFQVRLLGFGADGGLYAIAYQDAGASGYLELLRFAAGAGGWSYSVPYVFPSATVLGGLPSFDATQTLVGAYYNSPSGPGIYRLSPSAGGTVWQLATLYSFPTVNNRRLQPIASAGLASDASGNLYGVAMQGRQHIIPVAESPDSRGIPNGARM